eukprot:scaffold4342_cov234-Pinguiococcus_pyrenoidosus.AAC.9
MINPSSRAFHPTCARIPHSLAGHLLQGSTCLRTRAASLLRRHFARLRLPSFAPPLSRVSELRTRDLDRVRGARGV